MITDALSTNMLNFVVLDFDWDEYKETLSPRIVHDNQPTALIDPDTYLPPELRGKTSIYHVEFNSYKQAELTVSLIGILSIWSIFTEQDDTGSSYHRRIYLPNIHILHYIDENFVQDNGKIQLEKGPLLRVDIHRQHYNLEARFKKYGLSNRRRKRIDNVLKTERIPHRVIWENRAKILRKNKFLNRHHIQSLFEVLLSSA